MTLTLHLEYRGPATFVGYTPAGTEWVCRDANRLDVMLRRFAEHWKRWHDKGAPGFVGLGMRTPGSPHFVADPRKCWEAMTTGRLAPWNQRLGSHHVVTVEC